MVRVDKNTMGWFYGFKLHRIRCFLQTNKNCTFAAEHICKASNHAKQM